MDVLGMIDRPQDLRRIKRELLPVLASEIRQRILDVTSRTGGHLGAGLGTVELTIALHYCFESPKDKIVWDTGHQAYPHKLVTGRRDRFHTIRQYGGLSGFLTRKESEHDHFGAGHASTAVSAALGFASARDVKGEDHKVVAVVNDGSLTGGMTFEALQNAGHQGTDMLVVINDNQMFISHRVGAFGAFLAKLLTLGAVTNMEKRVRRLLTRVNFHGAYLMRLARRVKVLLFPGMLFEEMGFSYMGPVDGHNLNQLIDVMTAIKQLKGPVVLHVVTKKGRGYERAEQEPIKYHGVTRFNPETGEMEKPTAPGHPTYTKVFGQTLVDMAKQDRSIVAITAAMPEGTGLDIFRKELPDRFFDVGLGEQHAVTFAAGLACGGVKPVVAIYSTFMQRAFDQIMHDVALQKLPVVMCLDRGGLVGDDGPTHHGAFDLSYVRLIPDVVLMSPKDENELRHMLKTALAYNGPVVIRYPRGEGVGVSMDADLKALPIGKAETLREGTDLTLLAIGNMVYPSLQAASLLEAQGVSAGVVNTRYVKPLDEELLRGLAQRTRLLVTVEENTVIGGLGDAVRFALQDTDARVRSLGIGDAFVEHGTQAKLRELVGLSPDRIASRCLDFHKQSAARPA